MPEGLAPVPTIAHVDAETGFSGGEEQVSLPMDGLRRRGHPNVLYRPPGSRSPDEARGVPMENGLDLRAVLRLRRELAAGIRTGSCDGSRKASSSGER